MVAIKPIIMTNKNLTLLFIPLMCVSNLSLSATGIKTEHQSATPNPETHFPRIEIYRVKDYGNPASEEKHPENDGTVHYMEKNHANHILNEPATCWILKRGKRYSTRNWFSSPISWN